tara:strand:+ start:34018 stop:35637 length:1620 start_codon:yes stop_codon:yes gene_type:complete
MDDNVIIGIAIAAFVLYMLYHILMAISSGKDAYRRGYQKAAARDAAKGKKPFGESWGHEFGGAYFLLPQQIIEAGYGFDFDETWKQSRIGGSDHVILGVHAYTKGRHTSRALIASKQQGHLLTIAPTRSGKGVSAVIPNLLMYQGSAVVLDIKGEISAVTAERREFLHELKTTREAGEDEETVFIFNPGHDGSCYWNPFSCISRDAPWEDCRLMAELLVPLRGGDDAFWDNEARNFLTGLLLYTYLFASPDDRNLYKMRGVLAQEKEEREVSLLEMQGCDNSNVQRALNAFLGADSKVQDNILSTLNSHLGIFDDEKLARHMGATSFFFRDIKAKRRTIYVTVSPKKLSEYAPLLRLFFGLAVNAMTHEQTRPEVPVLFMLDEFPALGRVKSIEEGVSYLAGYGIKLWIFAQDLKQLAATYGTKAESIIANCYIKQFFGVSDIETAKLVSSFCGDTTVPHITYSSQTGVAVSGSNSVGGMSRPLMSPDEITTMDVNMQLIFIQGQKPILAYKINYLEANGFFHEDESGLPFYGPNPFYT